MTHTTRKKIAVLGGGMASLTTALELTSHPGWDSLYDITVYQLGWRLGGKGASGRNMTIPEGHTEPTYRIEEHGLHIFFGFYENAFRVMKECYDEMGGDGPHNTVEDAFKPHDLIVLQEYAEGNWNPIELDFPTNRLKPWEGGANFSLWSHIYTTLQFVFELYLDYRKVQQDIQARQPAGFPPILAKLSEAFDVSQELFEIIFDDAFFRLPADLLRSLVQAPRRWQSWLADVVEHPDNLMEVDPSGESLFINLAMQLVEALPENPSLHQDDQHSLLINLLDRFASRLQRRQTPDTEEVYEGRWRLALIDLALANIRGLFVDGIVYSGNLAAIDHLDYRDWLFKHGARNTTLQSAFVRVLYDLVYSFPKGDITNPQLAAGVAIRIMATVIFQYNGSIMWKMQGGMGDVVFTPIYQVLKNRGVKFEFFHRVKHLGLNNDQSAVGEIVLGRQVTLKDPSQAYDPLIAVKGLLCWPSSPRYEQLVEGDTLKADKINLESFWSDWEDVEILSLKAGEDFDIVVLGISLAALPFICGELAAAQPKWQAMFDNVKTVPTQGGQLWLTPTLTQLGWPFASAVVGSYVEPLDTYSDMAHLLPLENWPVDNTPHNLAYFTGVIADPGIPPQDQLGFPAQAQAEVDARTLQFLRNDIGTLWPNSTLIDNPEGLDPQRLVDLTANQTGLEERFQSQYWRINIFPTERYVMAVPGSGVFRLKTDESGFDHLYLTGDWIDNTYNAGCIEATVMSSMQAARAILKREFDLTYGKTIIGEGDSWILGKRL
ncbi:MAG: NAD(P)-binding protein [Cyanobacteria bacterium P01_A01_bin.123]